LYKYPPDFPLKYDENSRKIRHPPNANITHEPNIEIVKFGGKIAHLTTPHETTKEYRRADIIL